MNDIAERAAATPAAQQTSAVVSIRGVSKTYASGLQALKPVDLDIRRGEIEFHVGKLGSQLLPQRFHVARRGPVMIGVERHD